MKIGIIGSVAFNSFYPSETKNQNDIDIVASYDDAIEYINEHARFLEVKPRELYPFKNGEKLVAKFDNGTIIEAELAWPGSLSEELLNLIVADGNHRYPSYYYASPDIQYMLKMSHRFLKNSPFFWKTRSDIMLLRDKGAVIRDEHQAFFQKREKATYNYGHPKLNVSKGEFFDNSNDLYVFMHDDIHKAVALYGKPAYEFYKEDTNEVLTSKELFFAQPEGIRLAGAYEEMCVLALERSIIPYPVVDPDRAFRMAASKISSSISSGWFRNFCWENLDKVLEMYYKYKGTEKDFIIKFKRALEDGQVRPFEMENV